MYSILLTLILQMPLASATPVSPRDLVINPQSDWTAPARLTPDAVAADLETLRLALREGYAGQDFGAALNNLAQVQSPSQMCAGLAQMFSRIDDAHLRASLDFQNCGLGIRLGQVGGNLARDYWALSQVTRNGRTVDVLAIPRFWAKEDPRWNGFLAAVDTLVAKKKTFVLDLRGNVGGDDDQGFEMARRLLGLATGVDLPTPLALRRFRQTPTALAILSNTWAWQIARAARAGQTIAPYLEQRRQEILGWMSRAENHQFPDQFLEILPELAIAPAPIFPASVYVLVDAQCASSCETTLQVLEALPNRILVGENSMGAVSFGEVGRVLLPNSKVVVTLATMNADFRDHRQVEKLGYAPDLRVAPGADALDAALEAIYP